MQNVQNVAHEAEIEESTRPDSLFGICQSVGEQLGFNPLYLRIALIGLLFFGPLYLIGTYIALGMIVGISHLLFPKPEVVSASAGHRLATIDRVEQEQSERAHELIAA